MDTNFWAWPTRVYYDDTDAGGIVYHANYLRMMERSRTEWLRGLGIEQDGLRQTEGKIFVVVSMEIQFIRPAVFNDALLVTVQPIKRAPASLMLRQEVVRTQRHDVAQSGSDVDVLCRAEVRIACLMQDQMRPTKMPNNLLMELDKHGW
jgi:acyl-CoA thioester hydrolase